MKKLLGLLTLVWLSAACVSQQARVDVNDDYLPGPSLNHTYAILQSGDFRTLSEEQQQAVQQEIDRQMQARGYRKVGQDADIAIVFSLYGSTCTLREARLLADSPGGATYTARKQNLKKGTLVIQMVDENLNRSVWLGYASGLLARGNTNLEDRELKAYTRQIFDEYKLMAPGYVKRVR